MHTSYGLENGATSVLVSSPENDVLFLLLHHQSNLHTALYVHWSDIIRETAQIYDNSSTGY